METNGPLLILIFVLPAFAGAFLIGIILRWLGKPLRLKPLALGAGSWLLAVIISALVDTFTPSPILWGVSGGFVGGLSTCLSLKAGSIRLTTMVVMQSSLAWAASFAVVFELLDAMLDKSWDIGTTLLFTAAGTIGSIVLVYGLAREQ